MSDRNLMPLGEVPIESRCSKCGGKDILVEDETNDESIVVCKSCGAQFGTWGKVREDMRKAAEDQLKEFFKKKFGDNFKP